MTNEESAALSPAPAVGIDRPKWEGESGDRAPNDRYEDVVCQVDARRSAMVGRKGA